MLKNNFLTLGTALTILITSACDVLTKSKEAVFDRYNISDHAMSPTLHAGESYTVLPADTLKQNQIITFFPPAEFREKSEDMVSSLRLVGLPGDTLEMREGILLVNGKAYPHGIQLRHRYIVDVETPFEPDFLNKKEFNILSDTRYEFFATDGERNEINQHRGVKMVTPCVNNPFRVDNGLLQVPGNNLDNWGPVRIPAKNDSIKISDANMKWYRILQNEFESHEHLTPGVTVKVKKNYFFVLGDNRHNAEDSRFIGFVPYDAIVGVMKLPVRLAKKD